MANQAIVNIGAYDAQLTLNTALPAGGNNVTTGILDFSSSSPNGNAWRMGRLAIIFPALPENVIAGGITVALQAAGPSLVNSLPAPASAVPGIFATPPVSQTATLAGIAGTGTVATIMFMTLPFDLSGSTFQFVQFVITTTAGIVSQGENIQIAWVKDSP